MHRPTTAALTAAEALDKDSDPDMAEEEFYLLNVYSIFLNRKKALSIGNLNKFIFNEQLTSIIRCPTKASWLLRQGTICCSLYLLMCQAQAS